jgi:hypothetical protein
MQTYIKNINLQTIFQFHLIANEKKQEFKRQQTYCRKEYFS